MKKHLVVLLAVFLPLSTEAQDTGVSLSHQVISTKAQDVPPREHLTYLDLYRSFGTTGVWLTAYQQPLYFSFAGGPYVSLTDQFEVGLGIGGQSEKESRNSEYETGLVYAAFTRLGPMNVYYEIGRSGGSWTKAWYQADVTGSVGNVVLGLFGQTDVGIGPQAGLRIPINGFKLHVWGSPALFEPQGSGFGNWKTWQKRSLAVASLSWER